MIYQWKNGSTPKLDPQVAGEELERIRTTNNGRLEAAMVVDASKGVQSPLHSAFEWDDTKAAKAHREEQARYLIRSIEIVVKRPEAEPTPLRAFVNVKRDTDRSYTSTVHALSDPELRAQVIATAWRELEAWQHRHAELVEFGGIFAEIDKARAS